MKTFYICSNTANFWAIDKLRDFWERDKNVFYDFLRSYKSKGIISLFDVYDKKEFERNKNTKLKEYYYYVDKYLLNHMKI